MPSILVEADLLYKMEESVRFCDSPLCRDPATKFIFDDLSRAKVCDQHVPYLTERKLALYDMDAYDFTTMEETQALEVAAQYAERARTANDALHFESALTLWNQSLYLLNLRFPRSKQAAKASLEVGRLLYEQWNRRQEAKSALNLSLEIQQSYDPASQETFEVGNLLGGWLMYNEEYDAAERLLTYMIQTETRVRPDHESTLISICFLGWVYLMTHRKEKAAEMARRGVEEGLKRYPTSEATAQAFGLLGAYYQHENQLVEAETNYRKAVDIFTVYCPKLPDTGAYLSILGSVYHLMGRYTDAERTLKAALTTLSVYFPVSDYMVTTLTYLGLLYSDLRQDQDAETRLKEAIRLASDSHPASKLAAHALCCLAQFHFSRSHFPESISAYKEAKNVLMTLDSMSEELAVCLCNCGLVHSYMNEDEETEQNYKDSALIFAAAAPMSGDEGNLLALMGQFYHKKQQHALAELQYIKSIARLGDGSQIGIDIFDLLREEYQQRRTE